MAAYLGDPLNAVLLFFTGLWLFGLGAYVLLRPEKLVLGIDCLVLKFVFLGSIALSSLFIMESGIACLLLYKVVALLVSLYLLGLALALLGLIPPFLGDASPIGLLDGAFDGLKSVHLTLIGDVTLCAFPISFTIGSIRFIGWFELYSDSILSPSSYVF